MLSNIDKSMEFKIIDLVLYFSVSFQIVHSSANWSVCSLLDIMCGISPTIPAFHAFSSFLAYRKTEERSAMGVGGWLLF